MCDIIRVATQDIGSGDIIRYSVLLHTGEDLVGSGDIICVSDRTLSLHVGSVLVS